MRRAYSRQKHSRCGYNILCLHSLGRTAGDGSTDNQPVRGGNYSTHPAPLEGTILVVDDDALVRTSVRAYLELNGMTVRDAADAFEALKIASELKEQLVLLITDVVMPKMMGTELARALGNQLPELPIIFMSGYAAGEKGQEEFRQAKFLQKPFTCDTLLDTVRERLRVCRWQGKIQN